MSELTDKVDDAAGNAIFASLVSQALLEMFVVKGLLTNADVVNLLVHVREQAKELNGPEAARAVDMARQLDTIFRKRATAN